MKLNKFTGLIRRIRIGRLAMVAALCGFPLLIAPASLAGTVAVGPPPSSFTFGWQDESKSRQCGQGCIYQKGNENLSLDAAYSIRRLYRAEAMINRARETGSRDDYRDVVSSLGTFCDSMDLSGLRGPAERAERCFSHYRLVTVSRLRRIREAVLENSAAAASLGKAGRKGDPGELVTVGTDDNDPEKKKQALAPDLPKLQELSKAFQDPQSPRFDQKRYQKYLNDEVNPEPLAGDFVQFDEIDRDPSQPGGDKFLVPRKDAKRRPDPDKETFGKAQKEFAKKSARAKEDIEGMKKKLATFQGDLSVFEPARKGAKFDQVVTDEMKRDYIGARNLLVESVDKRMKSEASKKKRGQLIGDDDPKKPGADKGKDLVQSAAQAAPATPPGQAPGVMNATVNAFQANKPSSGLPEELPHPVSKGPNAADIFVGIGPQYIDSAIGELK